MLLLSAKCSRLPGRWENSLCNTTQRTILKRRDSFSRQWLNITRFLHETSEGFTNLARKFCQEYSSDMRRREFGKEMFWSQTLRNWKTSTHRKSIPEVSMQRKYLRKKKGEKLKDANSADGTAKLSGRDHEFREPAQRREQPVGSKDLSRELQGEPEGPQPTESKNDAEARKDFWSIQGDFIYRHHIEPRGQLQVPKEETFPVPLKYIEVTRTTYTNLDVLQEERADDNWNVDVNRSLSDSWQGFTKFTLLKENSPKGYMWSGRRLTKKQATTRPKHVWPGVWTQIGKAAQQREKQEWAIEKPKLDNA